MGLEILTLGVGGIEVGSIVARSFVVVTCQKMSVGIPSAVHSFLADTNLLWMDICSTLRCGLTCWLFLQI